MCKIYIDIYIYIFFKQLGDKKKGMLWMCPWLRALLIVDRKTDRMVTAQDETSI